MLSTSDPLPFPVDDASGHKGGEVGEEARLRALDEAVAHAAAATIHP